MDGDRGRVLPLDVRTPYGRQQLTAGEHGSRRRREVIQQIELEGRHVDDLAIEPHLPGSGVEGESRVLEAAGCIGNRRNPAQDGPHPCRELPWGERLDDVVIGAQLESEQAIHFLAPGREEDDRHVGGLPQLREHRVPVELGQHDIEHDQRGIPLLDQREGGLPIGGLEGLEAISLEIGDDDLPDHRFVIDDQDRRGRFKDTGHDRQRTGVEGLHAAGSPFVRIVRCGVRKSGSLEVREQLPNCLTPKLPNYDTGLRPVSDIPYSPTKG